MRRVHALTAAVCLMLVASACGSTAGTVSQTGVQATHGSGLTRAAGASGGDGGVQPGTSGALGANGSGGIAPRTLRQQPIDASSGTTGAGSGPGAPAATADRPRLGVGAGVIKVGAIIPKGNA